MKKNDVQRLSFVNLDDCEGKTIKAVITATWGESMVLAFTDGTKAMLEAVGDNDADATIQDVLKNIDVDSVFGAFSEDDLLQAFDTETIEQWKARKADYRKQVEQENLLRDRAEYERLKAKFENR